MRKLVFLFGVLSAAALLFSCAKELEIETISTDVPGIVSLVIDAGIEGDEDADTKTEIDGYAIKWSSSTSEKLTVYEKATKDDTPSMANKTSNAGTSTDSYATMTFTVSLNEKTADNFVYYASYPSGAWVSTNSTQAKANIETSFVQTQPSTTSFDSAADLLIAKSKDNGASQATSLSMQFARVVAIGKMTIKNLPVDENVTKVTFSANNGSAVTLAGRTNFDLDTAEPVTGYGDALAKTSINVITSGLSAKATSSMDVFFTCYPFELTTGNTFTVVVEAGAYQVSRTVTIPSARELNFEAGKVSRFSVDMSEGEISMQQPWVLYSGSFTAGDYLLVTSGKAMNTSIASNRFGYTSVTAVGDEIYTNDTDIIWRAAASSTYWTLYNPDADKYAASTGTASQAQLLGSDADDKKLWTVSGSSSYSFVNKYNSANSVNANLKWNGTNGFACYASGTMTLYKKDSRPYLSTPASVTAAVNGSDDSIIDVTFSTVANAGTYVIVASPAAGDNVVKDGVTSSPATIAVSDGLEYNTTYSISVYAVPSDPASYRSSLSKKASGTVTTGDWPAASYGDALWSESFTGLSDGTSPTAGTTTLYGGGKATYAYNPSRSTVYTKIYTDGGPGTGNNLLISYADRNDQYWAITGIPTSGWDAFTLTYKANGTLNLTGTSGVSFVDISASDNVYVKRVNVTGSPETFGITFTNPNTSSGNIRIDDVVLSAGAPIPNVTVTTSAATATASGTGQTATLNGTITLVNGASWGDITECGFKYKTGAGDYTTVTVTVPDSGTSANISKDISSLTKGSEYTYYAYAMYKPDSNPAVEKKGSNVEFTPTQSALKTYTLTITASDFTTVSYADNNGDHDLTATATDSSTMTVRINSNQVYQNSGIQFQAKAGVIYNKTDLGSITSITTVASGTDVDVKYIGATENPSSNSGSGGYFKVAKSSKNPANLTSITIVFQK